MEKKGWAIFWGIAIFLVIAEAWYLFSYKKSMDNTQSATTASSVTQNVSEDEAYAIGIEAYQYLYPLVMMDVTRKVSTNVPAGTKDGFGPMNTFSHFRAYPDANFRSVMRANFDTLYSIGWLDLTKEPLIVSTPDTKGRYFLMPMLDMWTDVFAAPGSRTSGTAAGNWALVAPGWKGTLPQGVERIDAPTSIVWVVGRTKTDGAADYDAVHAIQDKYLITPLSQWGKAPQPVAFKADPSVDMKTDPLAQVNTMPAAKFFSYAAELMKLNSPHATDWSQVARLKQIGIVPGQSFDFEKASPAVKAGLERATVDGLKLMKEKQPTLARIANGWSMNTDTMGVFGNYYLKRAIIAMTGLGANVPEDAFYPMTAVDAAGNPLNGSSKYVLHFKKDEVPPVNAFWSLTLYDEEGFQVANVLNRFALGSYSNLKYNPDGSLDLYIQNATPGSDKESNWLPAPTGKFNFALRLYWPKAETLDGRWNPPGVTKVQ